MEENIKIDYLNINKIKPYKRNAKKHPQEQIEQIINSIKAFGMNDPIGVWGEDNVIVEGHGRYLALREMGESGEVPVIHLDNLTDEQRKAYALAHNQLTMNTGFDDDILSLEMEELDNFFDMSDFGFGADDEPEATSEAQEVEEDDFDPDVEAEARCKRGQVWQLGNHRLMCGDSTSAEDVARLMNGEKADVGITSPPYGESESAKLRDHYIRGAEKRQSLYNEHKDTIGGWRTLIDGAFENMKKWSKVQFINIQMLADNKRDLIEFLSDNVINLCDIIIWDKMKAPPQMQKNVLNNAFEFVFIFSGESASRSIPYAEFHGNINNIIRLSTGQNEYANIHRAVFPIAFPATIMQIVSKSEKVLDLFGGTGTTMIAAEQLERKCFMMELDPKYCDVILKRYEDFTGREAVLIEE